MPVGKDSKYRDIENRYNELEMPERVFLNGSEYNSAVVIINGYNGYESSEHDGLFAVYGPGEDGRPIGYLTDDAGRYIRATSRRGASMNIQDIRESQARREEAWKKK